MPAASSGFGNGGDAHPTGLQLADGLVGGNETILSEEAVLFDMAEPVRQRLFYVVKLAPRKRRFTTCAGQRVHGAAVA